MMIRNLQPDDDPAAVGRVYEQSWRYAYQGIMPQDYLDHIPVGRWAAGRLKRPGLSSLVMLDGAIIAGTASYCASRFESMAGYGELVSLYLLPDYMGKGFGGELLQAALRGLAELGFRDAFLWVLEKNRRARRFYEKHGFYDVGIYLTDKIGGRTLRDVQYRRSISTGRGPCG